MNVTRNALGAISSQFRQLSDSSAKVAHVAEFSIDEGQNGSTLDPVLENAAVRVSADANIRANTKVIQTEDEMVGQLLDIFA
jgi:hypothetical protein